MITREKIYHNSLPWFKGNYKEKKTNDYHYYDICTTLNDGFNNFQRFSRIFDFVYFAENKQQKDGLHWCATFVITTIGTTGMIPFAITDFTPETFPIDKKEFFKKQVLQATGIALYSQRWTAGVAEIYQFMGGEKAVVTPDKAKIMDIMIFGDTAHTGFFENFKDGIMTTIEGNANVGVATSNGGSVCRKKYKINSNGTLTELFIIKKKQVEKASWKKFKILSLKI